MAVDPRRVAVLGAGTIGEALISGLISNGWREPGEIVATGRREERVDELRKGLGVEATLSNADAVAGAALIVIAVKPQDFGVLLDEIASAVTAEQTVLSVAAAIPTTAIEERLAEGVPVVRALTGGSAPGRADELAAELEPDWSRAGVWWGDERCVPPDDERSNFGLARRTLFDRLEVQPERVHRIRGEEEPDVAAASYER